MCKKSVFKKSIGKLPLETFPIPFSSSLLSENMSPFLWTALIYCTITIKFICLCPLLVSELLKKNSFIYLRILKLKQYLAYVQQMVVKHATEL